MAWAHVGTSSGSDGLAATSLTVSHTLGSGSNRLVRVSVSAEGADEILSTLTFNGVAMNLAVSDTVETPTWIYTLGEGSLPAGGSSYDAVVSGFNASIIMGVSEYTGVEDQAAEATNSSNNPSGTSYSIDVTTVTADALVVGAVGQDTANTHTATGSQTERWALQGGGDTLGAGGDILGPTTPGTVTYSGTFSGSKRHSQVVAAFEITTGGGGSSTHHIHLPLLGVG